MKAYQHILLATDFSKFSEQVAKKAINLAGHFNAQITLLHVIEHFPEDVHEEILVEMSPPEDVDPAKHMLDQTRIQLEKFAKSIHDFNLIPLVRVAMNGVEAEIIKVAREIKSDLIIIGAHDENSVPEIAELNADKVKQKASCDVLVVHAEAV